MMKKLYALYYFLPKSLEKKVTLRSGTLLFGAVVGGLESVLSLSDCFIKGGQWNVRI